MTNIARTIADLTDKLVLGIDLGTTNSAVTVWDQAADQVVVLRNSEGSLLTPSVVGWSAAEGGWLVGEAALDLARDEPGAVAHSIKRYIGRWFSDPRVLYASHHLAYRVVSGGGRDQLRDVIAELGTDAGGEPVRLSAPEVSAQVLAKLRRDAATALDLPLDEVAHAVITVPAYFNVLQRRATRLAGELAGFTVADLVNEPTAAALATARDRLGPETRQILVYDFGGGTLDLSLLEALHDDDGYVFDTRIVHGDASLGGDDIDIAVAGWLSSQRDELQQDAGRPQPWLRAVAERAKVALSNADVSSVDVPLGPDENAQGAPACRLTREQLEACASEVLGRARVIAREAIEEIAETTWDEIDEVILVGGQALMPAVRRQLAELGAHDPHVADRPQLAVALGAGEYAHMLSLGRARFQERALVNVLALPLGIRLDENRFKPIVNGNKTLPHRSPPFHATTVSDNQLRIDIDVLQGPRTATQADECVLLGSLEMEVPPARAGTPKFEVVFDVQADGTLQVVVSDAQRERTETLDIVETGRLVAWTSQDED